MELSTLRSANTEPYGKEIKPDGIVLKGAVEAPPRASMLLRNFNKKSPQRKP